MKGMSMGIACLCSIALHGFECEVQLENEQVCVAKIKIMAHEEIGLHRDAYPQVVIALQGGTITRLEADGSTTDVDFPQGVAVYREADPQNVLHRSVNKSSNVVELIVVQLKP